MNEILKKLLAESGILTDESKQELEEAFSASLTAAVDAAVAEAKAETIAQTKIELHEQYTTQREMLIEAIDSKVNDFLLAEMKVLRNDIKAFRDLEAEKIVEIAKEKKALGKQLKEEMVQLVKQLDIFLETRLHEEFKSLKADIHEAKKLDFGRKVFEAFAHEYNKHYVNPSETEAQLVEAKTKLDKLFKNYKNVKKEKEELYRKVKLESVLAPLSGYQKDLMESILSSVATDKLEEAYKLYVKKVIKESIDQSTGSKSAQLDESAAPVDVTTTETIIIDGDTQGQEQPAATTVVSEAVDIKAQILRLAGLG